MAKSVFISKHSGETQVLQGFAAGNDLHLVSQSFLHFEPIPFLIPSSYDVIFFGSPRAVMFYQSRYSIPDDVAIASVGGKTSALLQTLGYEVAFNGEDKGSISEVAEAFQNWLADRIVLFPVSTKSLGTISKGISSRQVIRVECYDTQIVGKQLEQEFDVYVFTSPSNVEGFFEKNSLPAKAIVIAWGESTEKALKDHIHTNITVLAEPSQEALVSYLQSN
ncbi:MAG: hypothetical protein Crog4KO_29570 [Crocinitomicaceae bacterium]